MLKSDKWIIQTDGIITPITTEQKSKGIISYGVSSYGYDIKVSDKFKIFNMNCNDVIDPKQFNSNNFTNGVLHNSDNGQYVIIPGNSFALTSSSEYFRIPRGVIGLMTVKSTYARCGLISPPTVLEPEWEGYITIELSNTSPNALRIYANEGIAQVIFLGADDICAISYADKKGKYQGQVGITYAAIAK